MYGAQNKCCFVPCCKSTSVKTPNKTFITVPDEYVRKKKWFKAARRDMPKSRSKFFCCEDHFKFEEDLENYVRYKLIGGKIILKPGIVPHIFDCQTDRKRAASASDRSLPAKRARKRLVEEAIAEASTSKETPTASFTVESFIESEVSIAPKESSAMEESVDAELLVVTLTKDVAVQANVRPSFRSKSTMCNIRPTLQHSASSPLKTLFKDISTSPLKRPPYVRKIEPPVEIMSTSSETEDESGSYVQSTSSSEVVVDDRKEDQLRAVAVTLSFIEKKPRSYLGVPEAWFPHIVDLLASKTAINKKNIMLTLMKIKLNDPFFRLGDMFGMSVSNVSKIFKKTLDKIQPHLKTLVFWPPRDRIKYLLPIPYRARYGNVQSIIDCFEIQIERPTDPIKQALTWSEYKKCNTIKYLISSTPDGFINFISQGYGGRITDSLLVQESGYLEIVPQGSSVMADRGFKDIGKLLHERNCQLVRPPSVSSSVKPTKDEVLETKRIASLRIHIERIIRRVREFEYLKPHSVIDHNLIGHTDCVINIACALINLQSSIIKQS